MSNITTATLEDVPAILTLVNSAYRGKTARLGWTHESDIIDGDVRIDEASLTALIRTPGKVVLVYKEDGQLTGCVYLEKQGTDLYLGMLSVMPGLQDRGIGKLLLAASEKYALDNGCTTIVMTVISVRLKLIEWYKRRGYIDTGERAPFPTSGFGTPLEPLEFITLKKSIT
jgi:ribosomal protein S18 acetylase RimI-like enzyme